MWLIEPRITSYNVCYTKLLRIESFRTQEGSALEKDIKSRISTIGSLLEETTQFEEERINKIKTRIRENLEEAGQKHKVDENRFEQELIYYLEKLDVTEEKVRLQNHLDYFIETMDSTEFAGKKLVITSYSIHYTKLYDALHQAYE